ncbi:MAG: hypothetical protein IOD12_09930 [Silvanigrellales bacterium]|nr:hypothetical protein [Silvanigrellales bacterium]
MAFDLFPVSMPTGLPRALSKGDLPRLCAQADSGFNFEAVPTLQPRSDDSPSTQRALLPDGLAIGLSIALSLLLLGASAGGAHRLTRRKTGVARGSTAVGHPPSESHEPVSHRLGPSWHALALLVLVFMAGNVAFGGLTAWLLAGKPEDAIGYFESLTALKLARLSHEHFFG